jgi:glutamate-1-semialdehyde 2,1-aminomutase
MNAIEERFRKQTVKSAQLAERAEQVMPGGDTRTTTYHRPYPLAIDRGEGPFLFDVDGNRYIDLLGNYTSLVHGHAYPPIAEAVARAARNGTAWPARSRAQIELAELLCERIPSVESIRFCNSGTEAGMLAAQVARHLTGRKLLVMARYGYHGSYDDLELGLLGHNGERTLLGEFGHADTFEQLLAQRGSEIAAVFLEPVLGSSGVVAPPDGFLQRVADAARRSGALFVLDEVITLRLSEGGAQKLFKLRPDLTMMGKIIGGGTPVGALGGRADIMASFDPRERHSLLHSGTFNGNVLTCSAGQVSVRELTQERIDKMEVQARRLGAEFKHLARQSEVPFSVRQFGSLMNIFFTNVAPPATIVREDLRTMAQFHLAALNHGLFIAPRGLIALSTVIGDNLVEEICERVSRAITDVARQMA